MEQDKTRIDSFISLKSLALVGVSQKSPKKFGNYIHKTLVKKGYRVIPIHPAASSVNGADCYVSISKLPEEVGGVIISVKPSRALNAVKSAHQAGYSNIWVQQGSESKALEQWCTDNGVHAITRQCIIMYVNPKGIHAFHKWLLGIFGKTPK